MPIIVQKFGGTSVGDARKIHLAARRAIRAKLAGNQVVLVVSAMGDTTDRLVKLAYEVTARPSKREMDMLLATGEQVSIALMAMAIHEGGYEAVSMTAAQLGLLTDSAHTKARIRSIDTSRARQVLDRGQILIVAGFQGTDENLNVTTLGRGGSDTTAVAVAAALKADMCEIYTDVDGVYTADPRLVPRARRIDTISYDEMLELASLGTGVMHSRSIEFGKKYGVTIHVRSSLTDAPGTLIMEETAGMEAVVVRGVTAKPHIGRVLFAGMPNKVGVIASIFEELSTRQLVVDDIIQNVLDNGKTVNIAFTLDAADMREARAIAELISNKHGIGSVEINENLARVSVVGVGMRSHTGVAAKMFSTLAGNGISIDNISTSEIVISAVIARGDCERAVQLLHEAFELDKEEGRET